ncbi:MAG TPA: SDR family NAD(P)-dependent oxidoreductase, partial [Candidatus Methylacidiphilales bacterium]
MSMSSPGLALLIGNSDGIGLETTRLLLERGWRVVGLSRSASPLSHPAYQHRVLDVAEPGFEAALRELAAAEVPDVALYCAGIGCGCDLTDLASQTRAFRVNLLAAAVATEVLVPAMLARGRGHFIGLSSIADLLTSSASPAYAASKAGITRYWEGLGAALAKEGKPVRISNVRFGFVDTKMAKAPFKPFQMTVRAAAETLLDTMARPRLRVTRPRRMAFLAWL